MMYWQSNLYQRDLGLSNQDFERLINWATTWFVLTMLSFKTSM
ncbi:hypothetical protein JCM19240_2167 [Vibrio maritimus]|uniref:Uncharacterized protein n=1 Tax=Vibrio maritimus TaxID=990268 RepID=A0A090T0L6_9VIBR|nr:hypothetical protein JCM19240_2167 [Vibrio maritimus]